MLRLVVLRSIGQDRTRVGYGSHGPKTVRRLRTDSRNAPNPSPETIGSVFRTIGEPADVPPADRG